MTENHCGSFYSQNTDWAATWIVIVAWRMKLQMAKWQISVLCLETGEAIKGTDIYQLIINPHLYSLLLPQYMSIFMDLFEELKNSHHTWWLPL